MQQAAAAAAQQQMYQQQWAGRVPQYPMGANPHAMGGPGGPIPGSPGGPFSYGGAQNFFLDGDTDPPKRKRGRPRKNPLKEPTTTKRKYTRKKPMVPNVNVMPGPLSPAMAAAAGPPTAQAPPAAAFNGLKDVMGGPNAMAGMANLEPGTSPSVYNFDDEGDEGEGGVQPMRPRTAKSNPKKYSFGSSSDEDNSKQAMMGGGGGGGGYGHHQNYQHMMRPMMRPQMQMNQQQMLMHQQQ